MIENDGVNRSTSTVFFLISFLTVYNTPQRTAVALALQKMLILGTYWAHRGTVGACRGRIEGA